MKIMFWENKRWNVLEKTDFDSFYDEIVQNEMPFKFVDCTEDEVDNYIDYINEESAGLDDCDYYSFSFEIDDIEDIHIFDDNVCYTLKEATQKAKKIFEYYTRYCKELEGLD